MDYDLCPECGYESYRDGHCYECGYTDPDYEYHPTVDADESDGRDGWYDRIQD